MKIKFKQGVCARGKNVSYDGGKTYVVDDDEGMKFVSGGYAVDVTSVKDEPVDEVAAVEESPEQATAEPQAKRRRRGRRGQ